LESWRWISIICNADSYWSAGIPIIVELTMPLTEKGTTIKAALVKQYGHDKGRQVFYAMKNAGKITGVDDNIKMISEMCDSLTARMDAFEKRQHQRKPVDVKPRTKVYMQPSMPHPKEPREPGSA
jgi:hypothetical protein